MARTRKSTDAVLKELRKLGLAYPGAHTKSPWPGHLDLAVKDKTFAYLSVEGQPFSISCKLPHSSVVALMLPFTKPTAYGLGKSGWGVRSIPRRPDPFRSTCSRRGSTRATARKRQRSSSPASRQQRPNPPIRAPPPPRRSVDRPGGRGPPGRAADAIRHGPIGPFSRRPRKWPDWPKRRRRHLPRLGMELSNELG